MSMITGIINDHFVVYKLRDSTRGLPVEIESYVRLFEFIKIVVDDYVRSALQAVFDKLFYLRQFSFRNLGDIVGDRLSVFVEICIKIRCLIILPFKFPVLDSIFSKLYSIHLRIGSKVKQKGPQNQHKKIFR